MFEDNMIPVPLKLSAWRGRGEELFDLLSNLPMEVNKADEKYGKESTSMLVHNGYCVISEIQGTRTFTSFLCGTERSDNLFIILAREMAKKKKEEEKLKTEIALGEKLTQELKESEVLQDIYRFMSYLKISGYPVLCASLTREERNIERLTNGLGWTTRIILNNILKSPGQGGICITPQGELMLKNFLMTSKNK